MKYKTIDLCAGIGGMRRGFELTGQFENVLSAEIDNNACKTYRNLFGNSPDPQHDISTDSFKTLVSRTYFDILLAGFPCQPFSHMGKKEGFADDTRGTIFFHIENILETNRPKAFLLENVVGLLSNDKGNTIKRILEILNNNLDYEIIGIDCSDNSFKRKNIIRNTIDFGLPQNRSRVFLIGFDRKRYYDKLNNLKKVLPNKRTKSNIFNSLEELLDFRAPLEYYMASGYLKTLARHKRKQKNKKNGFKSQIVYPSFKNRKLIANTILATGGSGKERNLVIDYYDGYRKKIINYKSNKRTPLNYWGVRVMTPEEWGKLQGFIGYGFLDESGNDTFSFPEGLSKGQKYKQFGNSVSIPVIEELAYYIYNCLSIMEKSSD